MFVVFSASSLRTPWTLGRGLRTQTPFIVKLQDEPVFGDEGPYRAFFAFLVDELQHNSKNILQLNEEDEENKDSSVDEDLTDEYNVDYSRKTVDGKPPTLALLVPTPNNRGKMGDNRECFMFNPHMLFYVQSQSYYCLGRIFGIAIRSCVPLHFDIPLWIWKLICNMTKYHTIYDDMFEFGVAKLKIDSHLEYMSEFDITCVQSLNYILNLKTKDNYYELLESLEIDQMLPVQQMSDEPDIIQYVINKYPFEMKEELVRSIIKYQMYDRFYPQICSLIAGICEIIPVAALQLFNCRQLQLQVCGYKDIDLRILKEHTSYRGDNLSETSELIVNLWSVVLSYGNELKAKFVDFIYAQKRLPSKQEFERKHLRLQISILDVENPDEKLPQSQTCFLNLQIPRYTTKESLRRNFYTALRSSSGFAEKNPDSAE